MTGQKKIVQIANRLGHSITYDEVLNIETVHANKAQLIINSREHSILPIIPASDTNSVSNVFWVDNCDINLASERSGGAINISTMMASQEINEGPIRGDINVNLEKDRSMIVTSTFAHKEIAINGKSRNHLLSLLSMHHRRVMSQFICLSQIFCVPILTNYEQ